ncbi:hypothetical protein ASG43_19620 [Aureimonas sp. Leaf454]|uniref:COG4223 family protein n=1 Tax=Aureimonas sp. Leaf454 TaxID=1736381 RepID=UPI0006FF1E4E|nr:hypothetical protein [Aureimonas sp. Leaf454]KQT52669.1 hypothetical protein ASG43_19620 [Aureimonas sp. Leaf454]
MSQPPRRSRPKRPGQTIDLKPERSGTVGYAGPVSPETGDPAAATGPEDRLAETATTVSPDGAPLGAAASLSATPETVDGPSVPAEASTGGVLSGETGPAGAIAGDTTLRDFAEDEGLVDPSRRERAAEEFDDEAILSAAGPDQAARDAAAAAKPSYDYHAASALTQPEPRGGGFGTALGAGLLGALLALGGAGALQYAGVLPSFGRQDPAELTQQFASIGDVQQVTADFATLRGDVEQLKSAQAAGGAGAGATTADLNAVADRVTAIEQRAAQAPTGPAGVDPAALDGVRGTAEEAKRIAEESQRIAADGKTAADDAKRAAGEATGAVDAIRRTVDGAVSTANNAQATAANAVQAAETAQQTATTAQAAATAAQQAASGAQSTGGAANAAVAALEPRIGAMEASSRQAAVSIAAASLKSAIDEGSPFMGQLERFAKVAGPSSSAVETLRQFAASGVPSKASLAADWPEAESAIDAALRPAPAQGDVGGQVLSGLSALVTVRPSASAAATADGSDAAVSRLSAAIAEGDLKAFLDEWNQLPEAAKTASADFQARVKARAEAEAVIGQTLDEAVQAVGTTG